MAGITKGGWILEIKMFYLLLQNLLHIWALFYSHIIQSISTLYT